MAALKSCVSLRDTMVMSIHERSSLKLQDVHFYKQNKQNQFLIGLQDKSKINRTRFSICDFFVKLDCKVQLNAAASESQRVLIVQKLQINAADVVSDHTSFQDIDIFLTLFFKPQVF